MEALHSDEGKTASFSKYGTTLTSMYRFISAYTRLILNATIEGTRNAGEGGRGGQAPLLPFAKRGKGGKSARFMKNDNLFRKC